MGWGPRMKKKGESSWTVVFIFLSLLPDCRCDVTSCLVPCCCDFPPWGTWLVNEAPKQMLSSWSCFCQSLITVTNEVQNPEYQPGSSVNLTFNLPLSPSWETSPFLSLLYLPQFIEFLLCARGWGHSGNPWVKHCLSSFHDKLQGQRWCGQHCGLQRVLRMCPDLPWPRVVVRRMAVAMGSPSRLLPHQHWFCFLYGSSLPCAH